MAISQPWKTDGHKSEAWQGGRAVFQPESSTRVCRSHALSQPEENADVAVIRCRSPVVLRVGHLEPNAIYVQG